MPMLLCWRLPADITLPWIRLAMIAAMCNPDPAVQKRWREIPHTGDTITPEDLITYIAKQGLPQ
jgi:hypothetical protein